MDTIEVNTMEIDGKEFFEIDIIDGDKNKYDFFAEINNPENIKVYKLIEENGKEFLEDVDSNELVEAFKLFNIKYN